MKSVPTQQEKHLHVDVRIHTTITSQTHSTALLLSGSKATRAAQEHRRIIAHLHESVCSGLRCALTLAHLKLLDDVANSLDDVFGRSSNSSGCCKRSFGVGSCILQHQFFYRFAYMQVSEKLTTHTYALSQKTCYQ